MTVHRRPFITFVACTLLLLPETLPGQGVRGELSLNWGWLQLRSYARDSIAEATVGGSGLQRELANGVIVTCLEGDFCRWYENKGIKDDVTPFSQDLRIAGWTGVQGLSFHSHLRTRIGSDDAWPRTEQVVDLLSGYLSFNRPAYQVRAGRIYRTSGLGYDNFDGASVRWRQLGWLWVDAFGGWSLAPGVNAPRNGELYRDADLLATERRGLLYGAEVGARHGRVFSATATYQREIRTDRLALYSERAALALRALVSGWAVDAGASYDFAFDQVNEARARVTTPTFHGLRLMVQARHYTPFFDYWTIWSAFSPVGFNEGRASATWTSRSLPLLVEAGGAYRDYEDADAGPAAITVDGDGWRGFGRVVWSPDRWFVDGRYRAEEGFGSARYGGDLILGRYVGRGKATYVALRGTSTEVLSGFRAGERHVTGGGLEGAVEVGEVSVDGTLGFYRVRDDNPARADDWTEGRATLGVRWRFSTGGDR